MSAEMGSLIDAGSRIAAAFGGEVRISNVIVDLADRMCLRVELDGRPVLVKIDSSVERSSREASALAAARTGGVAVPDVVMHDPTPPAVLALRWVDGPTLRTHDAGWSSAGVQLRLLHQLGAPAGLSRYDDRGATWREFLRWWILDESARCADMGALRPEEAERIRDALFAAVGTMPEPQRTFLHGDLQPDHVIVDLLEDRLVIVDWGDAGTGDPLWDLAVLLLDHPHRRPDVLDGYRPGDELRDHIHAHLDVYRLIRYLGEITWLLARGFDATSSITGARQIATEILAAD